MSTTELLERWREGSISDAELRDLTARLAQREDCDDLLDHWLIESALPQALGGAAVARLQESNVVPIDFGTRGGVRSWPHFAAVAGLAVAAAGVALMILALLPKHRDPAHSRAEVAAVITSTHGAIARLNVEPASSVPEWMSPTAALLEQPRFP